MIRRNETTSAPQIDLADVDAAIERLGRGSQAAIPLLQAIQNAYGYLPEVALRRVCERTEITPAQISGVSTFYSQFRHRPVGKHRIGVCVGTACHVKGAEDIHAAVRERLQIADDDDTDAEKLFTVEKVACLGCCTLAPAVQIDDVTYGHLKPETVAEMLDDFLHGQARRARRRRRPAAAAGAADEVRIGLGSCCIARGSGKVQQAVQDALAEAGASVRVKRVGCVGMCHQTPLLEIVSEAGRRSKLYSLVDETRARQIVQRHFAPANPLRRAGQAVSNWLGEALGGPAPSTLSRHAIRPREGQVATFLSPQRHLATEHCGVLDPLDLEEYIAGGGFEALRRAVTELSAEELIAEIDAAGLRGRGGAGFPTAVKWRHVAERPAEGGVKYVVCNGDEGDPGAFMDRMLLESYPFRVLEGLAIAARAVGASEGYLYIRAEYPLAVKRVGEAIDKATAAGLLGAGIAGSGVSLHLRIMEGAGAFVCGEETALLASIEGRRGMPRFRPPYPSASGLWGRPTLVNNTETLALVPWIVRNGGSAFAALGTERSPGTKVFSLAGKINRGGLIEVPMGVTIRQIVEDIGGGVQGGRAFKAVQVGGPSGGCIPAALAETPVDYEALTGVGAIMGSGGLVVLDDRDCMVEIARYFIEFTQSQSCGKCTLCRVGTRRMLEILTDLCTGRAKGDAVEKLEHLARQVQSASLCGLGKTAPNPVLSTLQHFRGEYDAHLAGRCPAGHCKPLIRYEINDRCIGCTLCAQRCPADAIAPRPYERHEIDDEKCTRCDACRQVCPVDAVEVR